MTVRGLEDSTVLYVEYRTVRGLEYSRDCQLIRGQSRCISNFHTSAFASIYSFFFYSYHSCLYPFAVTPSTHMKGKSPVISRVLAVTPFGQKMGEIGRGKTWFCRSTYQQLVCSLRLIGIERSQVKIRLEDGLYDVILESRKPEAKTFKLWITHEATPTIHTKQSTIMLMRMTRRSIQSSTPWAECNRRSSSMSPV